MTMDAEGSSTVAPCDRARQHRLLHGVDAHGDDLDVVAVDLADLPQPVMQRDRRHAAGRQRRKLGLAALRLSEGSKCRRRLLVGGKSRRQGFRCDKTRPAGARRRHDFHVEAARTGDRHRRDADGEHVERARRQRLDRRGAGIEANELELEPRFLGPAGAIDDVQRARADHRHIPHAHRDRPLRMGGIERESEARCGQDSQALAARELWHEWSLRQEISQACRLPSQGASRPSCRSVFSSADRNHLSASRGRSKHRLY
jgi:hypothetical protein